jgi:hypothetical protein
VRFDQTAGVTREPGRQLWFTKSPRPGIRVTSPSPSSMRSAFPQAGRDTGWSRLSYRALRGARGGQ